MTARSERFTTSSLDKVNLHAIHLGDERHPKMVLLHGGGANAHWWDHITPFFADRFHTVALDFRGHGDSDYPERVEPGRFQCDLSALLDHLDAPDAILVGHSMGGHIALRHAASSGAAIGPRAMVLIEVSRGASSRARRGARLALAVRRTYPNEGDAIARYRFVPRAPGADESLRRSIATQSVRREDDGRFGFKFDGRWFGLPPDPSPDLKNAVCPTLLVRGADSSLLSSEGAAALISELPRARFVEISAAGHHVQIERPAEVVAAMEAFLDETVSQTAN